MLNYILIQEYTIFLIGIMISTGIIKKYNLLTDLFYLIMKNVKSKRAVVSLVSMLSGVLPIPGRVSVSAGILNNIAPCCSNDDCNEGLSDCKKSRSKFGIIDYLATHHYYLWSPIEKTVIIPMAAMGVSWIAFLGYMWPLIFITVGYALWYIFYKVDEDEIILDRNMFSDFNLFRFIFGALPLFLSIILFAFGCSGGWLFAFLSLYYMTFNNEFDIKVINSFINWKLVFTLALVLTSSVFVTSHYEIVSNFISEYHKYLDISTITGFLTITALSFTAAFSLGSSAKYAGVLAMLITIYGPQYLIWFYAVEYFAYAISPTHKCIWIGNMYFGTSIKQYIKTIVPWHFIMIATAYVLVFVS